MITSMTLHRGARHVTREDMERVPKPPDTDTYFAVSHAECVRMAEEALHGCGYQISAANFALSRNDARMFATLDLRGTTLAQDVSLAVGLINSTDQSLSLTWLAGSRVWLCDNLGYSSSYEVKRRHTRHGAEKFRSAITHVASNLHETQQLEVERIRRLQHSELSPLEADSLLLQSFEKGLVSSRLLPQVIQEWRNPRHEFIRERTRWSMYNCFTEVLKERQKSNPQEAAFQTVQLGRLLDTPDFRGDPNGVIDVPSTPA